MTVALTIDDKIHGYKAVPQSNSEVEPKASEVLPADEEETKQPEVGGKEEESGKKEVQEPSESLEHEPKEVEAKADYDTDEYGNEVAKSRTYTEEEVQRMIRDRLSRGSAQQQPTQQQAQQATSEGFEADPNSNESWEAQLEQFIDRRLETREQNAQRQQWERAEQIRQMEYETKFTTGMEKYRDFREVVGKLPITDAIMTATREMKDPAAFLYAASKTHPGDIERIAALPTAIQQATEIGRLEERMKKTRNISNSSRPLANTKSDFSSEKVVPKRSIDDLINKHAKSKIRR